MGARKGWNGSRSGAKTHEGGKSLAERKGVNSNPLTDAGVKKEGYRGAGLGESIVQKIHLSTPARKKWGGREAYNFHVKNTQMTGRKSEEVRNRKVRTNLWSRGKK